MNLDITKVKAEQMDKLESTSIQVLQDYLDGKRQGGDDVVTARCILNVVKGNRQTQTAREGIRFGMAQAVGSESELKKYVAVTQPEVKKALTGK